MKTRTLVTLGLLALVAAMPLVAFFAPATVGADEAFVVLSGSMEPTFGPGDIIWIEHAPFEEVQVGDVVTFKGHYGAEVPFTHRVVEVIEDPQRGRLLRTQGDANEDPDPMLTPEDLYVGSQTFTEVPLYGYLIAHATGKAGKLALVVVSMLVAIWEAIGLATVEEEDDTPSEARPAPVRMKVKNAPFLPVDVETTPRGGSPWGTHAAKAVVVLIAIGGLTSLAAPSLGTMAWFTDADDGAGDFHVDFPGYINEAEDTQAHHCRPEQWNIRVWPNPSSGPSEWVFVEWDNGEEAVVPLNETSGENAYYTTDQHLDTPITRVTAQTMDERTRIEVWEGSCPEE